MKLNHQPDARLVTGDDHANRWGSANLDQKRKYAPVCHQTCDTSGKSNNVESCISRYVILVTRIHNRIMLIDLRCISQVEESWRHLKAKRCKPGWMALERLYRGIIVKIVTKSSSRCASRKWGWACNSIKICKSHPKRKYAPVWHHVYDKSKIGWYRVIYHQTCELRDPNQIQTSRERLSE